MPPFKRQHYLPSVYLKQFSPDGAKAGRKSTVWRLDEKRHTKVTVESQCAESYFYSSGEAQATEEMFGEMEKAYGRIAQKVWTHQNPAVRDYFGLILMMFDLHCRNRSYENQSGEENIYAYRARIQGLRNELLLGAKENVSDTELLGHLKANWRVRLLETAADELATSDNPSIWFTLNGTSGLHLIVLPITPHHCAVAFDVRHCDVTGNSLAEADQCLLNQYQVMVCGECLFTSSELSAEQQASVRRTWKKRERPSGMVDMEQWVLNLQRLRAEKQFGFVKRFAEP
ncbi:MAG: DUF4238 domain-containing protein [Verrucomicrobiota bacterium]